MADEPNPQGGADPTQAFQNRLNKMNGDAMAFATQLFDENFRLREDKRTLDAQLAEVKAKIPPEDAVVLKPAEAQDFEAYKAIGKPDEIQSRLDAHATLETQVAELRQKDVLREVADLHDFKLSVLLDRDKAAGGLEISFKEEKGNKVAYVKDGDKDTPITEFAESNWADYLPSLKVEQAPPPRASNGFDPKPKVSGIPSVAEIKAQKIASGRYAI